MSKADLYRTAHGEVLALLNGVTDPITVMASVCAVIHERLPAVSWTGFYRVVEPGLLRVGPYQGPPACLEIRFGRGVCGAAADQRRTIVVEDVHAFEGHIACDSRARSEIVVPVFDAAGELAAVLDLDSHSTGSFDEVDRHGLEEIAGAIGPLL